MIFLGYFIVKGKALSTINPISKFVTQGNIVCVGKKTKKKKKEETNGSYCVRAKKRKQVGVCAGKKKENRVRVRWLGVGEEGGGEGGL